VKFIAAYRDDYGVEPICAVLTESGCPIAPSTFYAAQTATPSTRACRDAELIAVIEAERRHRFVARLGPGRCGYTCAAGVTRSPAARWSG